MTQTPNTIIKEKIKEFKEEYPIFSDQRYRWFLEVFEQFLRSALQEAYTKGKEEERFAVVKWAENKYKKLTMHPESYNCAIEDIIEYLSTPSSTLRQAQGKKEKVSPLGYVHHNGCTHRKEDTCPWCPEEVCKCHCHEGCPGFTRKNLNIFCACLPIECEHCKPKEEVEE